MKNVFSGVLLLLVMQSVCISIAKAQPIQPILERSDTFYYQGNYKKALEIAREAATIAIRDSGTDSRIYGRIIGEYYAMNCQGLFKIDSAKTYYTQGRDIYRRIGATRDTNYATILVNLANFYNMFNQTYRAQPLFDEAYPIVEQEMSPYNINFAASLNNIALYYMNTGEYSKAEQLLLRCIDNVGRYFPSKTDTLMFSVVNLSSLYIMLGSYSNAYRMLNRYLRVMPLNKATDIKGICQGFVLLNDLSIVMPGQPLTDSINRILERLKEGRVDTGRINASININKTIRLIKQKKVDEALQSWNTLQKSGYLKYMEESGTPVTASMLSLGIYLLKDDIEGALHYIDSCTVAMTQLPMRNNAIYWTFQQFSATMHVIRKSYPTARNILLSLNKEIFRTARGALNGLAEQERWQFANKMRECVGATAYYLKKTGKKDNELLVAMLNNQVLLKSIIFNETVLLNKYVRKQKDEKTTEVFFALQEIKYKLGIEYKRKVLNTERIDQLELDKANEERKLYTLLPASLQLPGNVGDWNALRRQLQPREAIVDIITYDNYDKSYRVPPSREYAAVVIRAGDSIPYFIATCTDASIDSLIVSANAHNNGHSIKNLLRPRIIHHNRSVNPLRELYRIAWQNVDKYLTSTDTVYYIPNGVLNLMPVEVFIDNNGKFIRGKYNIKRVLTYQPLLNRSNSKADHIDGIELWGDIDYGYCPEKNGPLRHKYDSVQAIGPEEITQIKKVLDKEGIPCDLYTKEDASEERFKKMNHLYSALHLSTHGFYESLAVDNPENGMLKGLPYIGGSMVRYMLTSGVYLADARSCAEEKDGPVKEDGVLYSYEIKDIDLTSTGLVVLSACETGLGAIVYDEGILGVQQAFKMAGATKIIMSLWKISEKFTRLWMSTFYDNYGKVRNIEEAYRLTQDTMSKTQAPFVWAPFVLVQ